MIFRLLIFTIVIFAVTVGYQFAVPPVKNMMLEGKMEELAKNRARKSERSLRSEIMSYIREKDIPIGDRELVMKTENQKISLAARYHVDVDVLGVYSYRYEFFPASSERARLERHYQRAGRSAR